MRSVAERESRHDNVVYVSGSAESIPAADRSFDYCLLYFVWHHVIDRAVAAREVARVLRPVIAAESASLRAAREGRRRPGRPSARR
jgi:ubiquinone/menaquinone biosynthesis C-methylase UbiE